MAFRRHLCRALFEEHQRSLALLARLEGALAREGAQLPAPLAGDLARAAEGEIGLHFAFEEEEVFPLLAAAGEEEMAELLTAEHRQLLPLAERLAELALAEGGFWGGEFREKGAALVAGLTAHIEKEDKALLPSLDDLLDEEEDGRLSLEFASRR